MKKDKIFYPVGVVSASVAALVVLIIIRRVSGVPPALYGSLIVSSIVDVYPMTIQTRFLNVIVSLIIGFLTMLLFLLAETLFGFIMKKKREKNKTDKDVD